MHVTLYVLVVYVNYTILNINCCNVCSENNTPPPKIFRFFLKSEGKEIERKRKKGCWGGGGYLLTYFCGRYFFEWGLDISRGVEKFSGGVEKFSWGVEKFSGGGVEKFSMGGGELRNFRGGLRIYGGG